MGRPASLPTTNEINTHQTAIAEPEIREARAVTVSITIAPRSACPVPPRRDMKAV